MTTKRQQKGTFLGKLHLLNLYTEYMMRNDSWMKHKLESRLSGEVPTTSDMQMIPL